MDQLPPTRSLFGVKPATWVCAQTWNRTSNPLVRGATPSQQPRQLELELSFHSVLEMCVGDSVHCVCCLGLWWEGSQWGRHVQL